ncbi:hypothetical protein GCM10007332_32720 [Epilithonimonas arachidiradicis]|nr:hypothetical protein GCM10007332_32720 [Epilithonimonas arachidiradicis]
MFSKIYYKNYQASVSPSGESAFYSLAIVSKTRIDFNLVFGMKFVLNRDFASISSFPVTVQYNWPILAYLKQFDLENFSFTPEDIFDIALVCLNISEQRVINEAINVFVNSTGDPIRQFVDDVNRELGDDLSAPIPYPISNDRISELVSSINTAYGKGSAFAVFGSYILSKADLSETKNNLKRFFKNILPEDINDYILRIIKPYALITLESTASIEFPRNILKPWFVDGDGVLIEDPDKDKKTFFEFAKGLLYADTDAGMGYNVELAGTLDPKYSEIGNTGLLIQIERLKLDLSKTKNIPEADAYGYPNDFIGVYADALSITLPPKWFSGKSTRQSTLRLGGYNMLIGSGGLNGTFALESVPVSNGSGAVTSFFNNHFSFNYPVTGLKVIGGEEIIEVNITSYDDNNNNSLLSYINSLKDKNQYRFKYPLSITKSNNQIVIINSQDEFRALINSYIGDTDYMWLNLGKEKNSWAIGFKKFDISFFHGQVTSSHLQAALQVPKFKKSGTSPDDNTPLLIDLYGEWESKNNFKLSANFPADQMSITLFNYVTLNLQTAELGNVDGNFFIGADTKLKFPDDSVVGKIFKGKEIDLPAIRIYSNGRFEISGGVGYIPVNITLPLGPVEMAVTGIHLGSVQKEHGHKIRNYNYIGFDGSISIDPGGVEVKGNGVKYYYTVDNEENGNTGDHYIHITTLEVDLVIPGSASEEQAVAVIKGSLTLPDPGISDEFAGSVSIKIPQASIAGAASLRLNPKRKSFLVTAAVDFPGPLIPLGPVGIYGFAGLIGKKYVADKKAYFGEGADQKSWYDYYMAPERGINVQKFVGPPKTDDYKNPFSIGLGASIATMDGGKTLSLRAMMLLSIPNMFAIDAGLAILTERLGLADSRTAPFYAFIIIGDNSLEFGAGANYQLNSSKGSFIEIKAEIQAGFFFKNQKPWYVNFGTKQKPITATIFKDILNIRAESYLMLSAAGIEAGARVGFDFDLYIARAWVIVEVGAQVSFERPQVGGYMYIEGGAKISIFRAIEISIAVSIFFSVELVKPFLIFAQLRVQFRIKLFIIKIKFNVLLTFKWEKSKKVEYDPIAPLTYADSDDVDYPKKANTEDYVKGIHMLTGEVFKLDYMRTDSVENLSIEPSYPDPSGDFTTILPMDTFIDIKFEKGVIPSNLVDGLIGSNSGHGTGFTDVIPPRGTVNGGLNLRQVKHKYFIDSISIMMAHYNARLNRWSWEDYHPYEALFNSDEDPSVKTLKKGHWQRNGERYDTIRLLATTPFSYMDGGEPGWVIPEQYGITPSSLFCVGSQLKWNYSNFINIALGTEYQPPYGFDAYKICGLYYNIEGTYSQIIETDEDGNSIQIISDSKMVIANSTNPFDFEKSLEFSNGDNLIVTFPEPMSYGYMRMSSYAPSVTIEYYEKLLDSNNKPYYNFLYERPYTKDEIGVVMDIGYLDGNEEPIRPVSRMIIKPEANAKDDIEKINQEIAAIWAGAEARATETGTIRLTRLEAQRLSILEQQLSILKQQACSEVGCQGGYFQIADNVYVENAPLELVYFVNDQVTLGETLISLGYKKLLNIDFSKYSIVILCLTEHVADYGLVTNAVTKVTNKEDSLCFQIVEESVEPDGTQYPEEPSDPMRQLPYILYKYSIIKIDKTPAKSITLDYNCGCSDNDNSSNVITVCKTSIQEIQWRSMVDYEYEQSFPGQDVVTESAEQTSAAFQKTIQPIWRPNTKYLLHFRLRDDVEGQNGNIKSTAFDYFYGFKTKGPVGHFHRQNLDYLKYKENGVDKYYKEDEKPLTSLRTYLDYKRSYPNPDGNLLGSKPLFYGNDECKINLFFEKPYLHHMFNKWKTYNGAREVPMDMPIVIKDPVSEAIVPYPLPIDWNEEDVPGVKYSWDEDSPVNLPASIKTYIDFWTKAAAYPPGMSCTFSAGDIIAPTSKMRTAVLTDLKPQKLYTAQVYSAYDANEDGDIMDEVDGEGNIIYAEKQMIHEFGFVTSRYKNFNEQVLSYQLNDLNGEGLIIETKQAVYDVQMDLSSDQIDKLHALTSVSATSDSEVIVNGFDQAVETILNVKPLTPPVNTDFIKIINSNTNDVVAIIVRNPEPFNDPRIPIDEIEDTLKVIGRGNISSQFKTLFSKDYSQVILMHQSKKIVFNSITLQFSYKTWDGNERRYIVKDTLNTESIIITK